MMQSTQASRESDARRLLGRRLDDPLRVLLVTADSVLVRRLEGLLASGGEAIELRCVDGLNDPPIEISQSDAVLLDFVMLEASRLETWCGQIGVPVVVLVEEFDLEQAAKLVSIGVHDLLGLEDLTGARLARTLRLARTRQDFAISIRRPEDESVAHQHAMNDRFRALVQNSSDLITIIDQHGVVRFHTPSFERLLGFRPEERRGRIIGELVHPDDLKKTQQAIREVLEHPDRKVSVSCRLRHRDGSWRYFETVSTNLLDHPAVQGVVINSWDATERQKAEEALKVRIRQQAAIAHLGQQAVAGATIEMLTAECPALLAESLDVDLALVMRRSLSADGMLVEAVEGAVEEVAGDLWFEVEEGSLADRLLAAEEPVALEDLVPEDTVLENTVLENTVLENTVLENTVLENTATKGPVDESLLGWLRDRGMRSALASAIPDAEGAFGLLLACSRERRDFDRDDCLFLQSATHVLSSAIVRQRAEAALWEEEARFRGMVECLLEGVVINDRQGRVLYANPQFVELTGYDEAELQQLSIFDLAADKEDMRRRAARRLEGQSERYEARMRRKGGEIVWVEIHASPLRNAAGELVGAIGAVNDVSARRRAEERLRLLESAVEEATDGIVIVTAGPEPEIVYVNPGFVRLSGYTTEEVIGKPPALLMSGKTDPEERQRFHAALNSGSAFNGEMTNVMKGGDEAQLDWHLAPIHDIDDRLTHFVAILRDVTERRHLEEQLRQSQKMEAVGQLAGGVAHDFNNLLTGILGYSQLLISQLDPEDHRRGQVEQISQAAERAASLTGKLLAFSRRQVLQPRVLDVNEVIDGLGEMLHRLIGEHIELSIELSGEEAQVKVDPGQLEQVVLNLAINARDAMPEGGKLIVETRHIDIDADYARTHGLSITGPYVQISVSDTGTGMTPEVRARIFEPFFTTKETGKGTGLGLATVYGIVKQSGGHIWVYSESGEGTTFKVYLPLSESTADPDEAHPPHGSDLGGSETVLLAEDDDVVRALVYEVLTSFGYKVLSAANGRQALRLAERHPEPIVLLVSDVVMPDMRGPQLARELLQTRPEVRVLLISGYTDSAIIQRGLISEQVAFLQKPFAPRTLARKVREVLEAEV